MVVSRSGRVVVTWFSGVVGWWSWWFSRSRSVVSGQMVFQEWWGGGHGGFHGVVGWRSERFLQFFCLERAPSSTCRQTSCVFMWPCLKH